jgi:hypothetical protein
VRISLSYYFWVVLNTVFRSTMSAFRSGMEKEVVAAVMVLLRAMRLSLPSRPVSRDNLGRFPLGDIVYFRSATVRGVVLCGIVEVCYDVEHLEYDIRLKDGTKEFAVPDSLIVYSSPPRFSLETSLRPEITLGAIPPSLSDYTFGSTADLIAILRYAVSRETESRLGSAAEYLSVIAEQALTILVISILHICLGPVDKLVLYPLVRYIFDVITGGSTAAWTEDHSWISAVKWARDVLPLPEDPEEESQVVPVPSAPKSFRK